MPKFTRKQKSILKPTSKKTSFIRSDNGGLTCNQKIFVDQWLTDRNGTRAYKIAYPHIKNHATAGVLACQLLRLPKVSRYINEKLTEISDKAGINVEWVLKRYKMLVEYSIDDFFDDEDNMRPLNEIPKDKLYAVCGFKANKIITDNDIGRIETIVREFKLPDKRAVLDSLAKHLGMFEKDNEQKKSNIPDRIEIRIVD